MATIASLRSSIIAELNAQAATMGENATLTTTQQNTVSRAVDAKNETWNPNLPTRPTS